MVQPYYQEKGITIYNADCRDILLSVANTADLIIADPPYGANQAEWDKAKPNVEIWDILSSTLKTGATLYYWGFWGDADWILSNGKRTGLTPLSRIVWWFRTGRPEKAAYREDTEQAIYFSKGEPLTFNPESDLEPYEDDSNYKRYNRTGKHPGCVWIASRVFHNHPENVGHETQKPLNIISKMIRISSNPNDTVIDPYMGSGTTLRAAKELNRQAIGVEINERYCELAANRLRQEVFRWT